MKLWFARQPSPVGEILLVGDDQGALRALDFADYEPRMRRLLQNHYRTFTLSPVEAPPDTAASLDAYFAGEMAALDRIWVQTGGTTFQQEVWRVLRRIAPGQTVSYGWLAQAIGRPKATRPVGGANGANPVGIIVPCHRVIGSSGALTGYGGGIDRKRWLLNHERRSHVPATETGSAPSHVTPTSTQLLLDIG